MLEPMALVHWSERELRSIDLHRLAKPGAVGPALIVAVQGFIDAGNIGAIAAAHLHTELETTRIATFDADQLIDYRGRRSQMVLQSDRWVDYDAPYLALDYVLDREGNGFLLLTGAEPDLQWERVIAAIRTIIERFRVSLTLTVHGIPMPVPHTRPLTLTARGTRSALTEDYVSVFNEIRVPSSLTSLLEFRLGERGLDAMGFAIHVPHYFSRSQYPPAAVFALRHVERATGLDLGSDLLRQEGSELTAAMEAEAMGTPELAELIGKLEEQYDMFVQRSAVPGLLDSDGMIPNADDIAAQFEQYLREQDES